MDGFEKRKERKKDSIRRAALELFRSYGFKKVSISDIAERAGVSQVTIYNYFGSKEELIREVIKWYCLDLVGKYEKMMQADRPFLEKLEDIVFDKSEIAGQFQGEFIQTYIRNDASLSDFVNDVCLARINRNIAAFMEDGKREGCIDPGVSTEAIMLYFETIRRGFYNIPGIAEMSERRPELVKELIKLMTYGLNG